MLAISGGCEKRFGEDVVRRGENEPLVRCKQRPSAIPKGHHEPENNNWANDLDRAERVFDCSGCVSFDERRPDGDIDHGFPAVLDLVDLISILDGGHHAPFKAATLGAIAAGPA